MDEQMIKIIGLGEYAVSDKPEDVIKTYALGTCIGLVIYNAKDRRLGMVHIVLSDKQESYDMHGRKGKAFFADTAVPLLFDKVFGGYPDDTVPYQVSLYGGASSKNEKDVFCVGERNLTKIEEILQANSIYYTKRNTGGHFTRTIEAYVEDGRVIVYQRESLF